MPPTLLESAIADLVQAADRLPCPSPLTLELGRQALAGARPEVLAETLAGAPELVVRLSRLADAGRLGTGPRARGALDVCRSLGSQAVATFAMAADYAGELVRADVLDGPLRQAFARRAVASAVAARSLARRGAAVPEEDAFLGGLLLGVGQLALAAVRPEAYAPILAADGSSVPAADRERELLGFDHGPLDAVVLRHWGLPESLCRAVAAAPAPERLDLDGSDETTRRACELFHLAGLTGTVAQAQAPAQPFVELSDALVARCGLPASGTTAFLRSLAPAMAEVSELIGFPAGPGLDLATLAVEAADQAREWLAEQRARGIEDDSRDWHPALAGLRADARTGLLPGERLREVLLAALARRGREGLPLGCGLLVLRLDATRAGIGPELLSHVRQGDQVFAHGREQVVLLAPNATPVSLRALGTRLLDELDRGAAERGDAPLRAGGAASVGTRRACEADLLVREALEALARAEQDPGDHPACRVAGLF